LRKNEEVGVLLDYNAKLILSRRKQDVGVVERWIIACSAPQGKLARSVTLKTQPLIKGSHVSQKWACPGISVVGRMASTQMERRIFNNWNPWLITAPVTEDL
jgi:hypothetical protein